jgi:hypothetical protein
VVLNAGAFDPGSSRAEFIKSIAADHFEYRVTV